MSDNFLLGLDLKNFWVSFKLSSIFCISIETKQVKCIKKRHLVIYVFLCFFPWLSKISKSGLNSDVVQMSHTQETLTSSPDMFRPTFANANSNHHQHGNNKNNNKNNHSNNIYKITTGLSGGSDNKEDNKSSFLRGSSSSSLSSYGSVPRRVTVKSNIAAR